MIILKNLSCPMKSNYFMTNYPQTKLVDNGQAVNVDWLIKRGEYLTEEEKKLISRINNILSNCESDTNFQHEVSELFNVTFSCLLPRINILSTGYNYLKFEDNVKIYKLMNTNSIVDMEVSEFNKLILEQNIPIVFISEKYNKKENNKITEDDLNIIFEKNFSVSFNDENVLDIYHPHELYFANLNNELSDATFEGQFKNDIILAIKKIIKPDIECYNKLLDNINFDLPITRQYSCNFNGRYLSAENTYHSSIDTVIIAFLIMITHLNEINEIIKNENDYIESEIIKQNDFQQAKINKLKIELAERVKVRIKELEQRILNDETFKKCTRKQAFMYLKTILKEFSYDTDEDYEVLECLELSRTQYGDIRSKGYKAQSFIDDLWVKSREQK